MPAADEIQRFAKDLASTDALKAEVKALGTDQAAILALANANGYRFTMADVEALGQGSTGELNDEQLASVAGGFVYLYTDGTTTLTGGSYMYVYKSTKNVLVW